MRFDARISLLALVVGAVAGVSAPAAQAAFGVSKFESLTCKENAPEKAAGECNAGSPPTQLFTQAGGHPNFGITDFSFNEFGTAGNGVKTIRTDLPVGFATNPQAEPLCSMTDFKENIGTAEASHCPKSSEAGVQEITLVLPGPTFVTLTGTVYNLEPAFGLPLEFGIDIQIPFLPGTPHVHSFLEGGVSWHKEAEATEEGIASGDYHEFFKIKVARSLSEGEAPIARSRLVFNGNAGIGLNTTPTTCPGPQLAHLRVEPYVGPAVTTSYASTPTAAEENCKVLEFQPKFSLAPSSTRSDAPDGMTAELGFPLNKSSSEIENSDLRTSEVTLPAGMTINPAAAHGLEACTPEQFGVGTEATSVSCPPHSVIGTAVLSVPGLPPESLKGRIFLGEEAPGPITGPPYKVFLAVESARYGQLVRLEGSVQPNLATGQLVATFPDQPQGPFRSIKLAFSGGLFATLANPIDCGAAATKSTFIPYSGNAAVPLVSEFVVDSNGSGGACAAAPPFSPTQSTSAEPSQAGAGASFTINLERPEGQQYLSSLKTVLPPGLVALIPTVSQCGEPQASLGTCTSASQIGTVAVAAGSGEPFTFRGKVYLTGPYEGAPFGLSIVVPPVSGPFVLPNVIARARIEVKPDTAQVIATDAKVPTIVAGIPIRLRALNISLNRQGFGRNPTSCRVLATESTLGGFTPGGASATAVISTPFQAEGCNALAFKPSFTASAGGKPSRQNGASLETTINQPSGQANISSVFVTLPKQLPSRLATLQKACPEATFAANPFSCPEGSLVGGARANTPTLSTKLTGPAYLVSHGGAAFPDLDLVLQADGVRVILKGSTDIKKGITTTNFASTPDVPVSSITINLPMGPHSALAAFGNLCTEALTMPTTITGQNGRQVKQTTKIAPRGCGVQIIGNKVSGNTAFITVKTFEAGRVSGSGTNLSKVARHYGGAVRSASLHVPLSQQGRKKGKPLMVKVRVGFFPKKKGAPTSVAYTTVVFR
jgi:hypothetical protein